MAKEIKLSKLEIDNFKYFANKTVCFTDKTTVKGQNGVGKTTLYNALLWVLFDKDLDGNSAVDIRPHDENGVEIDFVDISVAATFDVDGREVVLRKSQRQKWVKKRGAEDKKFEGNENLFEVNGIPKSQRDYKAYVDDVFCMEDVFLACTNAMSFFKLDTKKRRAKLTSLVGAFTDADVVASDVEFKPLAGILQDGTVEELMQRSKGAIKRLNDALKLIPARIDEQEKSRVDIDVAEQELAKSDLERQIAAVDKKIEDAGGAVAALLTEDAQLQANMVAIRQTMDTELSIKRREFEDSVAVERNNLSDLRRDISNAEHMISNNKVAIEAAEKKRSELGDQYKTELARTFDEAPYLLHEEEWVFDDSSTICSSCGQALPADKFKQIKADFEVRKAKAKADAEKRLEDARERFAKQHAEDLERIKVEGFAQKHIIEELTANNAALQTKIDAFKKQENETLAKKADLEKQLSEFPSVADYSRNAEYMKLNARHEDIAAQIQAVQTSTNAADTFKDEKVELQRQLDSVNAIIAKATFNVSIDERIAELQQERRDTAQKIADEEKMLDLLEKFNRAKMNMLTDAVNKHFSIVKFVLFAEQINGGYADCCKVTVGGTDYERGLNHGNRILADLDILNTFQTINGVQLPIFLDDTESVDAWRVPDVGTQLILLRRTDDKEMIVEGA